MSTLITVQFKIYEIVDRIVCVEEEVSFFSFLFIYVTIISALFLQCCNTNLSFVPFPSMMKESKKKSGYYYSTGDNGYYYKNRDI